MSTTNVDDHVARLEAAIAGQESLRSTLGDAVVDAAIAALRQQLSDARAQSHSGALAGAGTGHNLGTAGLDRESHALASLRSHLPKELAAKARAAD